MDNIVLGIALLVILIGSGIANYWYVGKLMAHFVDVDRKMDWCVRALAAWHTLVTAASLECYSMSCAVKHLCRCCFSGLLESRY